MDRWQGVINAKEVASLYHEKSGNWLLLEVLRMGENGKAEEFVLVAWDREKAKLYELMEADDWDWNKKYVFVFADPDTLCEIN